MDEPYFRRDLALIHHLAYGFHGDRTAPAILRLLEPVRARSGLVLELGCGSGALTRHLIDAGHRVLATDASPAFVELAREALPGAEDVRVLVLPDDPLPRADAIVSVGHVLSYLPSEEAIDRAFVAIANALEADGVIALDICDREYGIVRREPPDSGRAGDDWAIVVRFSIPDPARFVRDITTFVRDGDDTWRRDDERHVNVLVDTSRVPALLADHGVDAVVQNGFGDDELPKGMRAIVGRKRAAA